MLITDESKRELEKISCAKTLTELFEEDPVMGKIISRFAAAKSVFLDQLMDALKVRIHYENSNQCRPEAGFEAAFSTMKPDCKEVEADFANFFLSTLLSKRTRSTQPPTKLFLFGKKCVNSL